MRLAPLVLALAAAGTGCVALPIDEVPAGPAASSATTVGVFPGLDPGAKELASLHFLVRAYGSDRAARVCEEAERLYARLMTDTGLYSFQPRGLYNVVVYADRDEFLKKTQLPPWSGGVSVGNAIYAYDGPHLAGTLAHEMTHLIFHEFMGGPRADLRWLNEGLAVHEETQASGRAAARAMNPVPFDQMTVLVPATERERDVSEWYRQVGEVLSFVLDRGGRIGFSQMLLALRDRRGVDDAVRVGFPGHWSSFADLEAAWLRARR